MSGGELDFEREWTSLSISLRNIHTKNASTLSFEELYRNAYKLVLKKKGEPLYNKVKEFEQNWLAHEVRPQILDELPPTLLAAYNGAHLTVNEKRVAGEKLLRSLKSAWEDHNLTMNMITDVLMYMVSGISFDDTNITPYMGVVSRSSGSRCIRCSPGQSGAQEANRFCQSGQGLLLRQQETLYIHGFHGPIPRPCPSHILA